MSERIEAITPEELSVAIAQKTDEYIATKKITEGFGSHPSYPQKAKEEQEAKEKIEAEIVAMAAEALGVLGYETVMVIIVRKTKLIFSQHHAMSRLRGKMLKYVTEHFLSKSTTVHSGSDAVRGETGAQARAAADTEKATALERLDLLRTDLTLFLEKRKPQSSKKLVMALQEYQKTYRAVHFHHSKPGDAIVSVSEDELRNVIFRMEIGMHGKQLAVEVHCNSDNIVGFSLWEKISVSGSTPRWYLWVM